MTTSESKGRFFYKTNRFESIRITNRIESIRIANWNALPSVHCVHRRFAVGCAKNYTLRQASFTARKLSLIWTFLEHVLSNATVHIA